MIGKNIIMAHISKTGKFVAMKTCEFYRFNSTPAGRMAPTFGWSKP
jgi:hypothetical protein